jgi:hypothetical protein
VSADPIVRIARQRIIRLSAELEVELANLPHGGGPSLEILRRLRDRAAESLAALPFLNVYDEADRLKIVTLQNEVKRYDEWVGWWREIVSSGITYDKEMSQEEREELVDLLSQSAEGQRELVELGLVDVHQDA